MRYYLHFALENFRVGSVADLLEPAAIFSADVLETVGRCLGVLVRVFSGLQYAF
jgi:hypothetical protein